MNTFEITWYVDDGYAGKKRPQATEIDVEDISGCESEDDVLDTIERLVGEDFDTSISWSADLSGAVAWGVEQNVKRETEAE